jgi:hypothetical protein
VATQIRFLYRALPGLLLLLAIPAAGQIQLGDNLNMNLNGIVTGGYNGVYGNQITSNHGLNFGGNGTLFGSYYNPNFLSFSFSPYYDQSRQNSEFRSLFNGGGFDFSSNIFGGSHFPGSFSYTRSWNSQGTFSMPGLADYTTEGNSQGFNISWSELLPDWPSLIVSFSDGSSDYSVIGAKQDGSNSFHNLSLRSGYRIADFDLTAGYTMGTSHADVPLVSGDQTVQKVQSDYNTFLFSASHRLPMHGSFGSSFSRSDINSDYMGSSYHGVVDTLNASAGVSPKPRLNFSVGMGYTDSLTGSLFQNLLPGGGQSGSGGGIYQSQQSSNSLFLTGIASYGLGSGWQMQAQAQRRQQAYLGSSYGANTFGGSLAYTTGALGGFLSTSLYVADNTTDNSPGNSLSFATNVAFSRAVQLWNLSVDFSYAQNVQTYLITYMNSFYTYSGNVRRRFLDGRLVWSASAAGSQSALNNQPHTGSSSQSYSSGLGLRRITASASYAKSDGFGLLGGSGLQPPPGTIPPDWIILYGGTSEAFSLSGSPIRNLSIGGTFSKARSNTATGGVGSWNRTEQVNAILNYRVRKIMLTAGYGRLVQGFSASGLPPGNVSSFYVGFSRSFNFF